METGGGDGGDDRSGGTSIRAGRVRTERRYWVTKSLLVARTHLRRVTRQQLGSAWKLVIVAFLVLFFGTFTVGGAWLARLLGQSLAAGDLDATGQLPLARGVAATVWLGLTAMIALRAAGSRGAREAAGGLLWVAPTRPIAVGLALGELVLLLVWIGLPAIVVAAGFALGLGSPLALVTVGVAVLVLTTLSVAVGYPAGLAIRHVLTRFPFVKRYRTPLIVIGAIAYVAAVSGGVLNQVVARLITPLSVAPPGWVVDLAVIGVPGVQPSVTHAVVAVAQLVVVWPAILAITWIANRHWFADPVLGTAESDGAGSAAAGIARDAPAVVSTRPRLERWLARAIDRPTATLVAVAYRRALRAPAKLLYAVMPFFFLVGPLTDAIGGGEVPTFTPVVLLLVVAWAAGVAFVLNPLGDQGSVLPATILSGISGTRFVRAHVLASLLVVLPVGIVAPVAAALVSPLDAQATLLVLAASPTVVVAGSLAGVGIGTVAPRYSSVRVSRSTDAVVPSKVAFLGFTLYLLGTAFAGLVVAHAGVRSVAALLLAGLVPVSIAPETIHLVAGACLLVLLAVPVAGYRYAVTRFETLTLESAGG